MGHTIYMSASSDLPFWLAAAQPRQQQPDWLAGVQQADIAKSTTLAMATKSATLARYELVFPRVLEYIYAGQTLKRAIRDLPGDYGGIDIGGFTRWMNADPTRKKLYREAKEIRTEAWADDVIRHAKGENEDGTASPNEVARDRLVVDSLKWLMSTNNRREYGDVKTIDVVGNISIVGALEAARTRVQQVVDVEVLDDGVPLLLEEARDEGGDDE